jgi:hypothetical protein
MSEEADIKVEIKQPETEPETNEDDKSWMLKLGEMMAKVEMLEKNSTEHKTWLEKLSQDADDAQRQSLQLREEMTLMLSELSQRLAEVEAMEIVEEMEEMEEIPEEIPEETPQIEVVEEENHEPERKRPPLIV